MQMIEFSNFSTHKLQYYEAWLYCLTLDCHGHKDWRMPTQLETKIYGIPGVWSEIDQDDETNMQLYLVSTHPNVIKWPALAVRREK